MSDAVMVPRVPTEAMIEAGYDAWLNTDLQGGTSITRSIWAAMLAASTPVGGWEELLEAGRNLQVARAVHRQDPTRENAGGVILASDAFDAAIAKATNQETT